MKQEVYRFAFDEANTELSQILGEFEQLRARKDRIEKVVEALKPWPALKPRALLQNGRARIHPRTLTN